MANMTHQEYEFKLNALRTYDAPYEIKQNAILELQTKFNTNASQEIAKQQLEESKPDISDIGDHL